MTDLQNSIEVLKVDVAGRVITPKEKRDELVEAYRGSGMTGKQFAGYAGVKYVTLMSWVGKASKVRSQAGCVGRESIRWVEASVEGPGESLWVVIGGTVKMEVSNSKQAGLVAEILGGLGLGGKSC